MRAALKSRPIRRLLAAYFFFVAAEWGTWLAVLIYAFDADGPAAVGLVAMAQLIPAAIVAPVAPSLIARLGRPSPLGLAYGIQALAVAATAGAIVAAPSGVVYLCAAVMTTSIGFGRPAHAATLVAVARTPEELTAANGAAGSVDGAGIVIGPALIGLLYGTVGPGGFLLILAAGLSGACVLATGLHIEGRADGAGRPSTRSALVEAVRAALDRRGPRLATAALAAAWTAMGLLDVLIIVLALDELGGGSALVGILNASLGVGGMIAGFIAARLVGSGGVLAIGAGLATAALGVGTLAILDAPVAVAGILVLIGVGHGLAELGSRSLLIRLVPTRSIGPVFGLVEGLYAGALALGAGFGPLLLGAAPVSGALAAIAVGLALSAALILPSLFAVSRTIGVPTRELEILRHIPLFAPLSVPTLERLARSARRLDVAAGHVIVRQGAPGDRFYAIERGSVEVLVGERHVDVLGPGDSFGEIALLRETPRTASVIAETDVTLIELERDPFLAAVMDHRGAARAAADVVSARLERDADHIDRQSDARRR